MSYWAQHYFNLTNAQPTCANPTATPEYGVFADIDGALILKRGYIGAPADYVPLNTTLLASGGLLFSDYAYSFIPEDTSRFVGGVIEANNATAGTVWSGPGIYLGPGQYHVSVELITTNQSKSNVLQVSLESSPSGQVLNSTLINGSAFAASGSWQKFGFDVNVPDVEDSINIVGQTSKWNGELGFLSVSIQQVSGPGQGSASSPSIEKCLPVTIWNNSTVATGTYDQRLLLDPNMLSRYLNHDLSNLGFLYQNGTTIPSWIEAGNSNQSNATTVWLRLSSLAPEMSEQIDLVAYSMTSSLFSTTGTSGEAPELSPVYGEYDNGASVFPYYWNFASGNLPTGWIPFGHASNNFSVNDGLRLGAQAAFAYVGVSLGTGTELDGWAQIEQSTNGTKAPIGIVGLGLVDNAHNDYVGLMSGLGVNGSSTYGLIVNSGSSNPVSAFAQQPAPYSTNVWSVGINGNNTFAELNYGNLTRLPSLDSSLKVMVVANQLSSGSTFIVYWLRITSSQTTMPGVHVQY
jgi:hypothetical protein